MRPYGRMNGRKDRHDEVFSQFCEHAQNSSDFTIVYDIKL